MFAKGGTGVLGAPEETYVPDTGAPRRRTLRRDMVEDFDGVDRDTDERQAARRFDSPGVRLTFRGGLVPRSRWGKVAGGAGLLCVALATIALAVAVRGFLAHDERFVIQNSSSIQIQGNTHLTRAQLLSVFGEDVERNIFSVSLPERRAELERMPWVEHATVMRLLPNRMRVAIGERTPVAYVRQGSQIGLVDASGVLLDIPTDAPGNPHYSFPVLTGIQSDDPQSTRAARVKIFQKFIRDLDSGGEKISPMLSEVDLSNPEDVKALIPDHSADVLVHFGDDDFLARYRKFQERLPEWRTQYPKLASVDMRYERQVVLEMQPGAAVPVAGSSDGAAVPGEGSVEAATAKAARAGVVKVIKGGKVAKAAPPVQHAAPIAVKGTAKIPAPAAGVGPILRGMKPGVGLPALPAAVGGGSVPAVKAVSLGTGGDVANWVHPPGGRGKVGGAAAVAGKGQPPAGVPGAGAATRPVHSPPQADPQ